MIIEIEDLRKRYGARQAVDGVTLSVDEGEFFGLLGPNGAGKSTLVEIVEGLRRADSGRVSVFGKSPWPRDLDLLARLGIQTQSSSFFVRHTAREHLRRVATLHRVSRDRADEVLKLVGLEDSADTRVEKLSGGQRQRLAIASALTHDPELLFLDEPTAALDPLARKQLWGLLKSLPGTVVYTTHHLDEAEALCDRVAIIQNGRIVAVDTPAGLRERTGAASLEDAYLRLVAA
ncbi:ABC transporter ATP-binding protein [Kutzneria sp. CA-103260]|uniref:ABC transporter ATP-binding protein n=1 Tax=Kutzneria sp. CA-103260 TaxID=2802641 RepID=UPI001BA47FF7|nr:ABC transporter ATP-binding protein [Kutzneria sp. CA-103260]QUQ68533.1 ABC transporter ATP-binding protein [Kutzneria sp. CA-103260]